MKRLLFSIVIGVLFMGTACVRQGNPDAAKSPEQLQYERAVYLIKEMGYDISDIRSAANGYIVEGDILLTQRHLDEFESRVQTRQNFNQYWLTVSKDNQKIQINSAFPYVDFSLDCLDAIQYWNEKSQCSIVLSGAGGNSIIDIITEPFKTVDGYEDFNTLMLVTPPTSDGYPGSIKINSQSSYLPKPSTEQAKYMILHAVGHAIGFTHTLRDPNDGGDQSPEEYGVLIEGTDYYDAKSIMVKESHSGWSGFSENDIKAFKAVYPTDEPEPEPEPEPEVDFSDRSMEWIADDGFAIAMGGPYAYGSVNIDVRVRLTGSEWADGQVRGMRIYDLYTGEEVMRGKAGSCRLQPGEYTLHYGAAVRREDGTFECRYGTADFEVTLPGFELTMPILSHPEDIDLSRTIVVRCSFETDDAAWRNFSCSVELVNLRTGEEITHQSYTPNERWAFRLTERGTYRAVATVSNGSETLVIRKDFVLPELTNPKDIYHTLNWRAIDFDKVIQYYIDFYSDEACTEKLSLQHSAACHYIVWRRHHDAEGNPTKNDKVMEDTVMLPAGVTTYNLPYTFEAKDYLTLHGYRYDYEIVGIEYR